MVSTRFSIPITFKLNCLDQLSRIIHFQSGKLFWDTLFLFRITYHIFLNTKILLHFLILFPCCFSEDYATNSEWYLVGVPANRYERSYACCPELYPDVTYTVIVKRRSLFFLCNLIFPMTMIGMLTMLSFLLPAESGKRILIAIVRNINV